MFSLLDRLLFRRPFEGDSARRYARDARPAFGDLDERLLDQLAPAIVTARTLLEVGCGPATFAMRTAVRFPDVSVIAIDPSREFARPRPGIHVIRAAGESLPLDTDSIDVAMLLSSIRHVADRASTFRELRRVVRGTAMIVELDPAADRRRIANHASALGTPILRHAFGPLVCRTAPPRSVIASLAIAAGWRVVSLDDDPIQPVYRLLLE